MPKKKADKKTKKTAKPARKTKKIVKKTVKSKKKSAKEAKKTQVKKSKRIKPRVTKITEYKKGDYLVYPFHGIGKIMKVENKEVLGKREKYYTIYIENQDMTVMVPTSKTKPLKIRPLCSTQMMNKALNILKTVNDDAEIDWKMRLSDNTDKIKTGNIIKVAEVARDLHQREKELGLSSGDKRVYRTARMLIIEETALVKKVDKETALKMVEENLKEVEPEEYYEEDYFDEEES